MSEQELKILYQDESIVVVDKPSGLLSVPGKGLHGNDSVVKRVKLLYPDCIDHPEVHRLDMDTSGIMVLALTKVAHKNISDQFQKREVEKRYIALLNGIVKGDKGRIELPFRLDYERRPLQVYDEETGKLGVTEWRKVAEEESKSRIEFTPVTGRTHQLRVHSAHEKGLGYPIVGDTLYGGHPRHGELKLHATDLTLFHPDSGERIAFHSEPRF